MSDDVNVLVGIDDTDSVKGMCTTYLAAILCSRLHVVGYPRLIRLNPNIPYKTRGNGAVSINAVGNPEEIKETVTALVEEYAEMEDPKTNPGIVFIEKTSREVKEKLKKFYLKTVSELVSIEEADALAAEVGAETRKYKNGRGIIGALAAVGADLPDKTYELIAYRKSKGKKKSLDAGSVYRMDKETFPETFNNIDYETGRILITPRGYDPVFCGIRGNSPEVVVRAWGMIKPLEDVERIQVFETNQGTDAHLRNKKISDLKPYDCAIVEGFVSSKPSTIQGGHILFQIKDETGEITCACYRQSGSFREVIKKLMPGDHVKVYGGLSRYVNTLNIEKIQVLEVVKAFKKEQPTCCRRKTTSAGKMKGYKCRECGKHFRDIPLKEYERTLKSGFYEPTAGSRRHLSKPLSRMINPVKEEKNIETV